ncbi:MAG: hypothetical protein FWG66_07705 [Spirochaetes bacterium]|nr:hypothetical protein [Spirochaetota bacterium]
MNTKKNTSGNSALKLAIIAAITAFLLAGCARTEAPAADLPQDTLSGTAGEGEVSAVAPEETHLEFLLRYSLFGDYAGIRIANEEFLQGFEAVHEIGQYVSGGTDLVIWATDQPLAGFEFSYVANGDDGTWGDFFYVQGEIIFSLDSLPQGHAILLRNHVEAGFNPVYAISFIDNSGRRRYVGFVSDLAAMTAPFLFLEFARESAPNAGPPPLSLPPWFTSLPNGAMRDTRVPDEIVDLVFRHFQAIEDGDVVAFRTTLGAQDGASLNMNIGLISRYFWDIVAGDYEEEMFNEWHDLTELGRHNVFYRDFPPVARNTGLTVQEIRFVYDAWLGILQVTTTNNEHLTEVHRLGLTSDMGWGIEWGQIEDTGN